MALLIKRKVVISRSLRGWLPTLLQASMNAVSCSLPMLIFCPLLKPSAEWERSCGYSGSLRFFQSGHRISTCLIDSLTLVII
jgi:hypothetical protein